MKERHQSSNGEINRSSDGGRNDDYSNVDGNDEGQSSGFNSDQQPNKRRIKEETVKEDRISAMPDSILVDIMSFLETKDAIKTGTLSHRWLYLWTNVPNLIFSYFGDCSDFDLARFINYVNQTLIFHKCSGIRKFEVSFVYEDSFASTVDMWVRFATLGNVKELSLLFIPRSDEDAYADFYYVLPQHVYKNSSITKLFLQFCDVVPNGTISWTSLKYLSIGSSDISEYVLQKILAGSPRLEVLELLCVSGFSRLDIVSTSLKKLVIMDYIGFIGASLEISGPNLRSLGIWGYIRNTISLTNVQSLVECDLNFGCDLCFELMDNFPDSDNYYEVYRNMLRGLLDRLGHVQNLAMGNWCVQVLSVMELEGTLFQLSPLPGCKCLTLNRRILNDELPGIAGMLHNLPHVETLVIDMRFSCEEEFGLDDYYPIYNWWCRKLSLWCSLPNLKVVKIIGLTRVYGLEAIEFFLRMAAVLQQMVIYVHAAADSEEEYELFGCVSGFWRSSPRVVISWHAHGI